MQQGAVNGRYGAAGKIILLVSGSQNQITVQWTLPSQEKPVAPPVEICLCNDTLSGKPGNCKIAPGIEGPALDS
jgi:hypothetical protein